MKILLAVDGSKYSEEALTFLSRFPFAQKPDVNLVHVCPLPDYFYLAAGIPVDLNQLLEKTKQEGQRILDGSVKACESWANSTTTHLLQDSVPGRAIVQAANENSVDLIAIGARGLGAIDRFLLGSVSDSIAKQALCSVLIIRPQMGKLDENKFSILIADDGSVESTMAIKRFAKLPLPASTAVRIMTVVNTFHAYHIEHTLQEGPALTNLLKVTQERLDKAAGLFKNTAGTVDTVLKQSAETSNRILEEADAWKPDLIVIGSTGMSGWQRALLGSVSTRVMHHSSSSIWIERKSPESK
ncbi:universal stress protein [Planctomicrobium sp. SH527]|uniref:universal stress protein n=1 Tax=Planctomicrobium sp. SH527 TaxID=3448123 RepID=UPI003F5B8905